MSRLPWLLFVAGCYQPSIKVGALCGPTGECPLGQICIVDVCQLNGTESPDAAADSAGALADVSVDASVWGPAMAIPGPLVNTGHEDDPSWTSDRLTIVFARDTGNGSHELFIGTRSSATAEFTTVTPLTELNGVGTGSGDKSSPEISPDGKTIYFTADANGDGLRHNVYKAQREGARWRVEPSDTVLSASNADEKDVALSPDLLTAMVARDGRLLMATRDSSSVAFTTPLIELPSLAVAGNTDVAAPSITNNAAFVYLHSGNPRKLYVAQRNGDAYTFTNPVPIHELDLGVVRNAAPFISGDGRHLLFARDNNLYSVER